MIKASRILRVASIYHNRGWITQDGRFLPVDGIYDTTDFTSTGKNQHHRDVAEANSFENEADALENGGWVRIGMVNFIGYVDFESCNNTQFNCIRDYFSKHTPTKIEFEGLVDGTLDYQEYETCGSIPDLRRALRGTSTKFAEVKKSGFFMIGGWFLPDGKILGGTTESLVGHATLANNYLGMSSSSPGAIRDGCYKDLFEMGWVRFWMMKKTLYIETSQENWTPNNLYKVQFWVIDNSKYACQEVVIDYGTTHLAVDKEDFLTADKPSDLKRLSSRVASRKQAAYIAGGWFLPDGGNLEMKNPNSESHAGLANRYLGEDLISSGYYDSLYNAGWVRYYVSPNSVGLSSSRSTLSINLHRIQGWLQNKGFPSRKVYIDIDHMSMYLTAEEFFCADKVSDLMTGKVAKIT